MERKNCWEATNCGWEPGGENAVRFDRICPAALPGDHNGVNRGVHRGRFCWAVSGTLCNGCDGEVQGEFEDKLESCLNCTFFNQVNDDESNNFILTPLK